ncbi:MAG: 4Fe-4S dicluster domain-containing protein [Deltaproteobacteria bacterium]|nr:4Fe-4S dicluster domain-containing protein [Deltaproteobacteria bacterium]
MAKVNEELCTGCGACAEVCPMETITVQNGKAVVGPDCSGCFACLGACPTGAMEESDTTRPGTVRPVQEPAVRQDALSIPAEETPQGRRPIAQEARHLPRAAPIGVMDMVNSLLQNLPWHPGQWLNMDRWIGNGPGPGRPRGRGKGRRKRGLGTGRGLGRGWRR